MLGGTWLHFLLMNRSLASLFIMFTALGCTQEALLRPSPIDACVFGAGQLNGDLALDRTCQTIRVVDAIVVDQGRTLTIPPGAHLVFDPGASLTVGAKGPGQLIALGLPDQRIQFSGAPGPRGVPGRWGGITFQSSTMPSSVLGFALVEGGGENPDAPRGCVSLLGVPDGAVVLTNLELAECVGPGLVIDGGHVGAIDGLRIRATEVGVRVAPRNVADFVQDPDLTEVARNVLIGRRIEDDTTIRSLGVRWDVDGDLEVGSPARPTLVLEADTAMFFQSGRWLAVGTTEPGSLEIRGDVEAPVRLSSHTNAPGAWHGVILGSQTVTAALAGMIVSRGGGEGLEVRGCVSIDARDDADIRITNTTISDCQGAAIGASPSANFEFGRLEETHLARAPVGVSLTAPTVASIGPTVSFEEVPHNAIIGGALVRNTSWAAQSIPWHVTEHILVRGEARPVLTLQAGLRLMFAPDRWLEVGNAAPGSLIVRGTVEKPVELTAISSGGWRGVVLGRLTEEGTTLEHTIIADAGTSGPNVDGCLSVLTDVPGLITVVDTDLIACRQSAVTATKPGFAFRAFARNQIEGAPRGLVLAPSAVASISGDNTFVDTVDNVVLGGTITTSGRWTAQPLPWRVIGPVVVDGAQTPSLSLDPGVELHFEGDGGFDVGRTRGGAFMAVGEANRGITFMSARAEPEPGDWRGIYLGPAAGGSVLEHVRLLHAGGSGDLAGLTMEGTQRNVRITLSSFGSNDPADVYIDCGSSPTLDRNSFGSPGGLVREAPCP